MSFLVKFNLNKPVFGTIKNSVAEQMKVKYSNKPCKYLGLNLDF